MNNVEDMYESNSYLKELYKQLDIYLPKKLPDDVKRKREDAVRREYGRCTCDGYNTVYDLQVKAQIILRDISVSHLLGCNDVVAQPLANEYAELKTVLQLLNVEYKRFKQFQELAGVVPAFKPAELKTHLYNDLMTLSNHFDLNLDLKELSKI